jgi:hypothetical protein
LEVTKKSPVFINWHVDNQSMRSGTIIIFTGVIMITVGLLLFYTIQGTQIEPIFRSIKHTGTFIGLLGIGITLAGLLLYLINRNQPQIKEEFEN